MSTISHIRRGASCSLPPSLTPLLAQGVIWAGAAGVLGLWWTGTTSVVGPADWLTGAGRITGLLAGYACAVLVALMARVPLLDHRLGTDCLARWHAMGGRYTISLVLAHTLLIIWGYSLASHHNVVSETSDLVLNYPDMLKATAAFLLLIATGIVSARAARRRMSYETWHYLHFATYLAVFLAFGHQLSNGADFVGHRPAQLAWYTLYCAVAALIAWYRFLLPVRRALRHRLRVADVRQEAPGVVSVHLTGHHLAELGAQPGQFFRWRFLAPGLWWTASPYSLSAPPLPHRLRITVKAAGGHSAALARLRPGTRVWAEGPYGALTAARLRAPKVLLIAGGVGITPLRALFETLPGEVTLLYRARRPENLALRAELDAIAAARGAVVHYVVSEPAAYSMPFTARALNRLIPGLAAYEVYLCGPPGMTEAAMRALRGAGVPRRHIHHESFEF
ncbi:ferric reductase [Streptomyces sp. RPA4-5]|uniref:ferredoxin reductase family protein n=1 Tax=Streptomyces TaxID=1883 RepID=UPI00143EBC63|nr:MULTISPECIES: ferric reductase-like transmembrane domain-containing protein [Streptomyces]MCX4637770.1 ferric reductase-like transmembrane domain-containing protein [Streptomyces platensis]QIY53573.1 ferric reductase [Streptomyces sp. RPA4-5]WJY36100.1 ferric reductase-like transmembrane domain-containing protein [Streptomyces sp. P9-2B-2]